MFRCPTGRLRELQGRGAVLSSRGSVIRIHMRMGRNFSLLVRSVTIASEDFRVDVNKRVLFGCRGRVTRVKFSRVTNTKEGGQGTGIDRLGGVQVLTSASTIRLCLGSKRVMFSAECCPSHRSLRLGMGNKGFEKGL